MTNEVIQKMQEAHDALPEASGMFYVFEARRLIREAIDQLKGAPEPKAFHPQTEATLAAILAQIEKGVDELLVRRIWDEARRAALSVNRDGERG